MTADRRDLRETRAVTSLVSFQAVCQHDGARGAGRALRRQQRQPGGRSVRQSDPKVGQELRRGERKASLEGREELRENGKIRVKN